MAKINFTPKSDEEADLLNKIAKRAVAMANGNGIEYDLTDAEMDLTAAHLNGCPLDLEKLLGAPDVHFGHDVFGIRQFINRNTGKVPGALFAPRCGARHIAERVKAK